jgi:hypothetical protein
VINFLL